MDGYNDSTYGERVADVYDEWYGARASTQDEIETLATLAAGGPVLELGVGTGRIAIPLAMRGLTVHGLDVSSRMLEQLRAKPGGELVVTELSDFSTFSLDQTFPLVFVTFNTLYWLPDQDAQTSCFASVSRHLRPRGRFVIEGSVPVQSRFSRGQQAEVWRLTADEVALAVGRHDPIAQVFEIQQVSVRGSSVSLFPTRMRYVWPSELDLMASLAGLRLEARWGGWQREPFTSVSHSHISVYVKRGEE